MFQILINKFKEDLFWVKVEEVRFEDDFIFQSLVENFSVKKRKLKKKLCEWF